MLGRLAIFYRRLVPPAVAGVPSNFSIITENREPILNDHLMLGSVLPMSLFSRELQIASVLEKIDVSFKTPRLNIAN